jgi:hypothetical protein
MPSAPAVLPEEPAPPHTPSDTAEEAECEPTTVERPAPTPTACCSFTRLRGLPWQAQEPDIAKFFDGIAIVPDGVYIALSHVGRPTGEAFVQFTDADGADRALLRNKQVRHSSTPATPHPPHTAPLPTHTPRCHRAGHGTNAAHLTNPPPRLA